MPVTPRYREIADELREAIFNEQPVRGVLLGPDVQLPTEPELAEHFGVGRSTIRRALQDLSAEGLIETRGRHGTFVRKIIVLTHNAHRENPDREDAPSQATTDAWFSEVVDAGMTPSQDFAFKIVPATSAVATNLRVAVDDLVVARECTRYADDRTWSWQVSYYPYDIAKQCGLDHPRNIEEGTVRRMAAHGVREIGWYDTVSSRPANPEEIGLFALPSGVVVVLYHRVAWTSTRPVRYTREVLPADRNVITYESGDLTAMKLVDKEKAHAARPGTP